MKGIPNHKLLVGGLGYAKQGSVGKFLEPWKAGKSPCTSHGPMGGLFKLLALFLPRVVLEKHPGCDASWNLWVMNLQIDCTKSHIHPRKLTWIPKIAIFERRYISKTIIFVIYVRFRGGIKSLFRVAQISKIRNQGLKKLSASNRLKATKATVDGSEIRQTHQLRLVVYPITLQEMYTSQVVSRISSTNKMNLQISRNSL